MWRGIFTALLCSVVWLPLHASVWNPVEAKQQQKTAAHGDNHWALKQDVLNELLSSSNDNDEVIDFSMPLTSGETLPVRLQNTRILPAALSARYPSIRTWKILAAKTDKPIGRMEWLDGKLSAGLTVNGQRISITSSTSALGQVSAQLRKREAGKEGGHQCGLKGHHALEPETAFRQAESLIKSSPSLAQQLVTYRLAVSTTLEYTRQQGGKEQALAAIAKTVNRINEIYERDLGVRFRLADDNDKLIVTDEDQNPFHGDLEMMMFLNQSFTDLTIGEENYDLGHVFHASSGGVAYIGSACRDGFKAYGISGHVSQGDVFDVDFVAHEIGHQFSATHTFSGNQSWCAGVERYGQTAFEPGSGSTVMSYAGVCGSDNLQRTADPHFHVGSIRQALTHKRKYLPAQCGEVEIMKKPESVVDAGADYVIPVNTAFRLQGSAANGEGAELEYSWQQTDSGTRSRVDVDAGDNALYRTYLPGKDNYRVFPAMPVVLGKESIRGEGWPSTSRILNFELLVYDEQGASMSDDMQVQTVETRGLFGLYEAGGYHESGSQVEVRWDVAETDLPPVSCQAMDILLSVDDGENFELLLAEAVENTGQASIQLPQGLDDVQKARFLLRCSDNIFFSVSPRAFAIGDEPESDIRLAANIAEPAVASVSGGGAFHYSQLLLIVLVFFLRSRQRIRQFFGGASETSTGKRGKLIGQEAVRGVP